MLRVGIIGCGCMGNRHSICYENLRDDVKIVAVADCVEEKAKEIAEKFGAKIYKTGMELMDSEELDYVDICLPTYLHTEHAVYAMEQGLNVFLEKPVCLNEEEAKLLLETQKKTGVKVQIGQVVRFDKAVIWLKEAVEKGTYGKLIHGSFHRLSAFPAWGWENWFADYKKSGTAALDLHVHDTDLVRYIMGEPTDVNSVASRDKDGVIQHIFSTFKYDDTIINVEGGWNYDPGFGFSSGYRVKLEKATAVFTGSELLVHTNDGETIRHDTKCDEYWYELKAFIDHINAGDEIKVAPLNEGIESVRLVWKEIEAAGGAKA